METKAGNRMLGKTICVYFQSVISTTFKDDPIEYFIGVRRIEHLSSISVLIFKCMMKPMV